MAWRVIPQDEWGALRLVNGQRAQLDIEGVWPGTHDWYAAAYVQQVYSLHRGEGWAPTDWWWKEPGRVLTVEVVGLSDAGGVPAEWTAASQAVAWWVGPLLLVVASAFLSLRIEGVVREIRLATQAAGAAPWSVRLMPWAGLVALAAIAWRYRGAVSGGASGTA